MWGCKEVWGNVWESVLGEFGGCEKVCWENKRRGMGEDKRRCGGVKKCGRVYGVSVTGP